MSLIKLNITRFKVAILLLVTVSSLLISGYFLYNSYVNNLANLKNVEHKKLKAIVATLATQIDAEEHLSITKIFKKKDDIKTNSQNEYYAKINELLSKAKHQNKLTTDIYTLVIDEKIPKNSFFVVSSSNPYFRHQYMPPNETIYSFDKITTLEPYGDEHGTWISAFAPIKKPNGDVVAIVQADVRFDEFISKAKENFWNEVANTLVIVLLTLVIIIFMINYMLNSLSQSQNLFFSEFQKLNSLSAHIDKFLQKILTGNFEEKTENLDEFKENKIFKSLLETEDKIAESVKKEKENQWVLKGKSELSTVLQENESIEKLCFDIIKYVVDFSIVVQGALYLNKKDKVLEMQAKYAYNRKKYDLENFKIGEGLVGQCGYEKDTIYRTEVPESYATITSGLIQDKKPSSVLLVPLLNNKDLIGVMEFASASNLDKATISFIEEVAIIAAQTIFNIQTNLQTKKFLDDALKMSSELNEQKLVLEQNAEEMKATQEEIERTNLKLEMQIQEVENQQNKLHSLLLKSSEIISIYSQQGKVMYESPSVEEILGFKPDELIGKSNEDRLAEEDKDHFEKTFVKILENPAESQTLQFRYKKKNGDEVWLESTGRNLLADPAIKGIVFNSIDITERRKAEKEQEMRAKMQALSENSQDIIIRFDLEGNFLYVNSRLRHYTGIFTTFTGKNCMDVGISDSVIRRWGKIIKDLKKQPKLIQREILFTSDTDEYIMQVNAIPEFSKNEELESILIVHHDVTERKKQETLIKETNQKITESINYARRIQNAIIPMEEEIRNQFNDFMMFYMPKDVVSGDFPWYYKKENYIYIAAVDCTGHGVPGAMMSLIGYLLLNDIVNNDEDLEPGEILLKLHKAVVNTLKQDVDGNNTSDGMDVSLLRISLNSNEVLYAGAHRPLYLLRKGSKEIEQFKGSPFPIGGMQYRGRNKYKTRGFDYQKGDSIFFFSDGLPDQFNKDEDKYSPQRIRELIVENNGKSLKDLENIFRDDLTKWMGQEKQIDDVLLMGINF